MSLITDFLESDNFGLFIPHSMDFTFLLLRSFYLREPMMISAMPQIHYWFPWTVDNIIRLNYDSFSNQNVHWIWILFAPKKCYLSLKFSAFYALELMFLTKFVTNSTIRKCSSGINLFNIDAKLEPNLIKICPK